MKKKLLVVVLFVVGMGMVYVQSSVFIYGLIDFGLIYYFNVVKIGGGGVLLLCMDSGIVQGSCIGFKGMEDLGGGLNVFFILEIGFGVDDGSLG